MRSTGAQAYSGISGRLKIPILTFPAFALGARYSPIPQNAHSQSSYPLHRSPRSSGISPLMLDLRPTRISISLISPSARLTDLIKSHSRPGVATNISAPLSTILFCFCALRPPITLPILIRGGLFCFLADSCSSSVNRCLTTVWRWSTT